MYFICYILWNTGIGMDHHPLHFAIGIFSQKQQIANIAIYKSI